MYYAKKCATGADRLHAALAATDPASSDLILIGAPGLRPAFRLYPLPALAQRAARVHAPGSAAGRSGPMPLAWRTRFTAPKKSTLLPV